MSILNRLFSCYALLETIELYVEFWHEASSIYDLNTKLDKEKELIAYVKDNMSDNTSKALSSNLFKSKVFLGSIVHEEGNLSTKTRSPMSEKDTNFLFSMFNELNVPGFVEHAEYSSVLSESGLKIVNTCNRYLCHEDDPATLQEKIRIAFAPKPT